MVQSLMFCLWLLPSNPAYSSLADHINDLATQYQAPNFQPHLTLFCGHTTNKAATIAAAQKIIAGASEMTLPITGVAATSDYYKSVFINFSAPAQLTSLFQQAKAQLDPQSQYSLQPHLSLLYQNLPLSQKQSIANEVQSKIRTSSITFDKAQLMLIDAQETPAAVKSWQTWYSADLGSSNS